MPRKEGPPLEERIQRAKQLFELKQQQKEKRLKALYTSRIYRFAKKTSIVFLWISQLILIDWILPYREIHDKISGGYFNSNAYPEKNIGGISTYRIKELFIKTTKGCKFNAEFLEEVKEPRINDSIIIYKSLLLGDFKKMNVPRLNENYLICNAITYKFFPFILLLAVFSALFLFIKNIEAKGFAWIIFICTTIGSVFLICYLIANFQ